MSKQSEAKMKQGYKSKSPTCSDCVHLKFDMALPAWMAEKNIEVQQKIDTGTAKSWDKLYGDELRRNTNIRCGIGGFAVKKQGCCSMLAERDK